jgi:hypothetical protein
VGRPTDSGLVIQAASGRSSPLELSGDRCFARRVWRLAATSAIALGLIWGLAIATLEVPAAVPTAFVLGWALMPTILLASLARPRLRYGLIVPASLVTLGLLAVCYGWLPADRLAAAGWLLLTGGVAVGGVLGFWLWYRLLPVPARLDDPFATGRWALIGLHVGLVVVGFALAATALLHA